MFDIVEKYKKYCLEYRVVSNVLIIYKPMLVKDFLRLKVDIAKTGIKLNNIIIEGRD